ncbi:hypothetical protein BDZ90DRAFT_24447 [Jaminaea rosea]|uniref:Uncharacterized protein n=1 Tax=Jaminaea rosea TaxID=1569628 RepID=A0A316V0L8_9BASI|nr:hypothetical protein BDZ90DRAFT_24447 [Jaminaea rosea]PWN30784.1 hypothetical protein BDZ90DRAFT_24447 [Jaminaea rosea]
MNIKAALGASSSRRASPERNASNDDAALHGKAPAPRRAGSFGKGLGNALANSMTRASEAVGGTKKSSSSAAPTPTPGTPSSTPFAGNKEFPFPAPAAPGTPAGGATAVGPDPQHLSNFSLRLSELVNQALIPTVPGAMHTGGGSGGMASVTKHAPGRASVPNLTQIAYEGKRLPNRAKIVEFAQLVVSELRYANGVDPYLLRAVSRAALKALTLFANRIDSLLVPIAKDPSSLIMPTTVKEGVHISAALEFNLGLATITWIVEDSLERCIEGDDRDEDPGMPTFVSEILTPVRKRMETTILHVIQPVLAGTKASLTGSILKAVRQPFLSGGSPALTPSASHDGSLPPLSPANGPGSALASPKEGVASGTTNWIKELQGRLDGSRKLLVPRIEARTSQDGEGWFISVVVHLIWKGLFVLSSRSVEPAVVTSGISVPPTGKQSGGVASFLAPSSREAIADANKRSPSPGQLSAALKSVASVGSHRGRVGTPGGTNSTAASGRATPAAAPDGTLSPPTATASHHHHHHHKSFFSPSAKASTGQLSDLQSFQKMCLRFCRGFVSDKALAAVAAELSRADIAAEEQQEEEPQEIEDEPDELARQALAEALEAINSTILVVQAMDSNAAAVKLALDGFGGPHKTISGGSSNGGVDARPASAVPHGIQPLESTQLRALKAIPPLLLLHIVYCRLPPALKMASTSHEGETYLSHPPALFGISWQEYERSIAGFVGGTSWAQAAIPRWQKEVEALWAEYSVKRSELLANKQARRAVNMDSTHEPARHGAPAKGIDEFGTTPTPARLAAAAAAAAEQRHSNEFDCADGALSRNITRSDDGQSSSASLDGCAASWRGAGSGSSAASSRQSSRVHSPAQSPTMGAASDLEEDMEGSVGALSLGTASQSATASRSAARPPVSKRFWKSSDRNGSASTALAAGAAANGSGARGFHLPSLTRPTFGSRTSSPAGSVRGRGTSNTSRSRSVKQDNAPTDSAAVANSSFDPALAAQQTADDSDLAEVAKCQEAVAFFAKTLEWAAWSAGMEGVRCQLGAVDQEHK